MKVYVLIRESNEDWLDYVIRNKNIIGVYADRDFAFEKSKALATEDYNKLEERDPDDYVKNVLTETDRGYISGRLESGDNPQYLDSIEYYLEEHEVNEERRNNNE